MNPHGQLIFCSASSEHRSALVRQNITCPSGLTHFLEYTRCAQVPKFPYLVHYTIDETTRTVLIAAVYGTRQEPFWE